MTAAAPPDRHAEGPPAATPTATGDQGLVPATRGGVPDGLAVLERPPPGGWAGGTGLTVVLVHGSLDHAGSFRRVARRLPELGVVVYDRRGYRSSRAARPAESLRTHVDDLIAVAAAYGGDPLEPGAPERPRQAAGGVCAVGHSIGGSIVLGAAIEAPERFAAVGAYEPSLPWFGYRRGGTRPLAPDADPGDEVERFFRRMVGDGAWERLGAHQRADRRADGPALLTDLRSLTGAPPFDLASLRVRAVVAAGGPESSEHHREGADWFAAHVPGVRRTELPDAAHGAHLTHPDAFAGLVRDVVALGRSDQADPR